MASLSETYGWRTAIMLICAMLLVAVVGVFFLMRDRPSDVGLPAYGDKDVATTVAVTGGLLSLITMPLLALKEASRRSSTFWVLFATFFVCGASTNGLIGTHFVALCGDYGLAAVGAASVLAMMGFFDFFGTIGSGWLSDRVDNRWLLFWYYCLRGLSLLYLPYSDFSFYGLSLFAMFYGLDWIATVPPTVKLASERFGREKAGLVFGWIFAGHQLGAASAAYGGGFVRTEYATYLPAFLVAGILCLIAAFLVLTLSKQSKDDAVREPAPAS